MTKRPDGPTTRHRVLAVARGVLLAAALAALASGRASAQSAGGGVPAQSAGGGVPAQSAGASVPAQSAGASASGDDFFAGIPETQELVVELRIGRVARQTVLARLEQGVLLIPAWSLFELAEMRVAIDAAGRLEARLMPENRRIVVDPVAGRAAVNGRDVDSTLVETEWTGSELYLAAPLVERLLDVKLIVDLGELTVVVDPAERLPVGRRVARERARMARLGAESDVEVDQFFHRPEVRWSGAAFDWAVHVSDLARMDDAAVEVGAGSNFRGGALDLRLAGGRRASTTPPVSASWVRAWPHHQRLRQLRVGTISGSGPRAYRIHGIAASNSPFYRDAEFGRTTLRGILQPGWEVEVYRNGELIDFTQTDSEGYYELEVEVDYGSNPLELRAYGPLGEMRIFERAIRVDDGRLPDGSLEYGVAAGACQDDACLAHANADLGLGVDPDWTLRVGCDSYAREGLDHLIHPYVIVSGLIRDDWTLRAETTTHARRGAEVGYEPSNNLRARIGHTHYDTSVEAPILTPDGHRSRSHATLFWRPLGAGRRQFLTASALRTRAEHWTQTRAAVGVNSYHSGLRLGGEWRIEQTASDAGCDVRRILGASVATALRARWLPPLRGTFVRGTLDYDIGESALDRLGLVVARSIGSVFRLEVNSGWSRLSDGLTLSVALTMSQRLVHSISRVSRTAGGSLSSATMLEGAVLWNEAIDRVEAVPTRASGRGGVSGVVFLDANSNHTRDPGEEGIENVRLTVGGFSTRTDALGRYSVWDLGPFDATTLAVDLESLENPLWVPMVNQAFVTVLPNGFRKVDIPVVPGSELTGTVTRDGLRGPTGIAGVRVVLRHLTSGRRFETMTFHDGAFYFLALPPGEFEVSVPDDLLERMGLRFEDGPRRVEVKSDGDWVERPSVDVLLRPVGQSE